MTAVRSDDLRSQNRRRALSVVRRSRVASRTDIGTSTGLSPATVSAITSAFLDEGILIPVQMEGVPASGRGRPQVALGVNPEAAIVCTAHFQLNRVSAVITDYAGNTLGEFSTEVVTHSMASEDIKRSLCLCIDEALRSTTYDSTDLCQLAVGFQGVIDVEGSTVLWTPIFSQRDIPVRDWLEEHFDVPTRVWNDCDLIARALHWRDPDKYGKNFGAVLLDHGVGMGLFLRNDIVNGTRSSGIEFGHMTYIPNGALCLCGNRGCIEAYAGDYAISRRALAEPDNTLPSKSLDIVDLENILALANDSNADAIDAIETAGAAIGTGLASLFALVDPFPIVLVGGGTIFFEYMQTSLRKGLSNAPGFNEQQPIEIDCYTNVNELVQEGGTVSALQRQDLKIATQRLQADILS